MSKRLFSEMSHFYRDVINYIDSWNTIPSDALGSVVPLHLNPRIRNIFAQLQENVPPSLGGVQFIQKKEASTSLRNMLDLFVNQKDMERKVSIRKREILDMKILDVEYTQINEEYKNVYRYSDLILNALLSYVPILDSCLSLQVIEIDADEDFINLIVKWDNTWKYIENFQIPSIDTSFWMPIPALNMSEQQTLHLYAYFTNLQAHLKTDRFKIIPKISQIGKFAMTIQLRSGEKSIDSNSIFLEKHGITIHNDVIRKFYPSYHSLTNELLNLLDGEIKAKIHNPINEESEIEHRTLLRGWKNVVSEFDEMYTKLVM